MESSNDLLRAVLLDLADAVYMVSEVERYALKQRIERWARLVPGAPVDAAEPVSDQ
jgi:hypothetical protein